MNVNQGITGNTQR